MGAAIGHDLGQVREPTPVFRGDFLQYLAVLLIKQSRRTAVRVEIGSRENLLRKQLLKEITLSTLVFLVLLAPGPALAGPDANVNQLISRAEQGDRGARQELGILYATGEGVEVNFAQARRWWLLAAEQGSAMAQFNLGMMAETGRSRSRLVFARVPAGGRHGPIPPWPALQVGERG